jgi:hypothetical protein
MAREVRRLLKEEGGALLSAQTPIATVTSELHQRERRLIAGRPLVPLGPQPGGDTGRADLESEHTVVVAQVCNFACNTLVIL